jgi:uncharacterized membrane protein YbjE (DUF340 family)
VVAVDPFLYVSLGAGILAGQLVPWRGRAINILTLAIIVVLIGLLGASLDSAPTSSLLASIPYAALLVALLLGFTLLFVRLLPHRVGTGGAGTLKFPLQGLGFLAALIVGFGLGHGVDLPYPALITYSLYALLFVVGFGLNLNFRALRTVATPVAASFAGALAASILFAVLTGISLRLALASSFGFSWYTLVGPLVATRLGAAAGLLAFMANFMRENLTMIVAPSVGPRAGPEALTAMGGASTMDTTLYFVTRYGDPESGSLALASGLILTISASLLVPAVLALPLP